MSKYARGFIKQDLHDSLISTVQTDLDTAEASITTIQAQLDDCTQSIVTGSRALGTNYQNTSGKTMFVTVAIAHVVVGAGQTAKNVAYVEAGDSTPDTAVTQVYTTYGSAALNQCLSMTFVVPAGSYYQVSDEDGGGGASTLTLWTEWTIL